MGLCCEALAATVGQLWEEANGVSSGRKLVVHGSVKPWLQAGAVSSGRKRVYHGAVNPWQLLSVSSGKKLAFHGAVRPHCIAQQASTASYGRKLVFPSGMQGPTVR